MVRGQDAAGGRVQVLTGVESQLAATLMATSDEVAHCECLDVEDRSEVYTILEAIRADVKANRETLKLLAHRFAEGTADA